MGSQSSGTHDPDRTFMGLMILWKRSWVKGRRRTRGKDNMYNERESTCLWRRNWYPRISSPFARIGVLDRIWIQGKDKKKKRRRSSKGDWWKEEEREMVGWVRVYKERERKDSYPKIWLTKGRCFPNKDSCLLEHILAFELKFGCGPTTKGLFQESTCCQCSRNLGLPILVSRKVPHPNTFK